MIKILINKVSIHMVTRYIFPSLSPPIHLYWAFSGCKRHSATHALSPIPNTDMLKKMFAHQYHYTTIINNKNRACAGDKS